MNWLQTKRAPLDEAFFNDAGQARFYDDHARRFMGKIFRRFAGRINELGLEGPRVLDVGTGTGLLSLVIAQQHPEWQVTGIDISEDMLKLASEAAMRNGFSDGIKFQNASAESLPFPDNSFDIVVSNASLHLWKEPVKVIDQMVRVTSPGGYCLIWDNLRMAVFTPLLRLPGLIMGMNNQQQGLWLKAVASAYTSGEAKALLRRSMMKKAKVKADFSLLELEIELHKPLN
jgi:ubiquinone/menaquinone biosynthesis C-methylase UbiE